MKYKTINNHNNGKQNSNLKVFLTETGERF